MMQSGCDKCNNSGYYDRIGIFEVLNIDDDIRHYESRPDHPWPENSIEIVKGLMREYFPWRIDGDKIKYYDDLKID